MKNENINYIGLGVCLGVAFGLLFDNLAIGAGIGLAIGTGLNSVKSKNQNEGSGNEME